MAEPHDFHNEFAETAAEIEPDAGVKKIANRYAEAILDAAEETGKAKELLDEFDLLFDVLAAFPKLEKILAATSIADDKKGPITNYLKVLARHSRLDCLRAMHQQLRVLYDNRHNRVQVTLTTAAEIDEQQTQKIAEALRQKLGAEPVLTRVTDPDLIGGIVIRVGDVVYDGSIANQLEIIRKQMNDKSAHEIQSGRDRFYHSTGD